MQDHLLKYYFWVNKWECFWIRLTFESIHRVKKIALCNVGGPYLITWKPEWNKMLIRRELLLEKAMASHTSTLAWKIQWMEKPGGLQSMGSLGVGHDWAPSLWLFTFMHWRRKWQPTPVFLPRESQGWGSLVGCHLWGRTESDTTEATQLLYDCTELTGLNWASWWHWGHCTLPAFRFQLKQLLFLALQPARFQRRVTPLVLLILRPLGPEKSELMQRLFHCEEVKINRDNNFELTN